MGRTTVKGFARWLAAALVAAPLLALGLGFFRVNDGGLAGPAPAVAGESFLGGTLGKESDADVWRRVRGGEGFGLNRGLGSPVLVQSQGEGWRSARNGYVTAWGGALILLALAGVAAFAVVRRRVPIEGGRSGRLVVRFTLLERVVHWTAAGLFVVMALTGLTVMFGKFVLIPVIGQAAFAALAAVAIALHNYLGPPFIAALVALLAVFMAGNFFQRADVGWILKGGGLIGGHASSRKYNFGEKTWYWLLFFAGIALAATGIMLDFPAWFADPALGRLASLVHGTAAAAVIAASLGHIYLGLWGVEGALEGMTRGTVDENWARHHHDLWYEELVREGKARAPAPTGPTAAAPAG
jgi:formate dehydrogenase subunit gamma